MGEDWRKFVLLMWKNWTIQRRHHIQTAIEILAPVLLASLLVLIRSLVEPDNVKTVTEYQPFSMSETNGTLFSIDEMQKKFMPLLKTLYANSDHWNIAWSPEGEPFTTIMNDVTTTMATFADNVTFKSLPYKDEETMYNALTDPGSDLMDGVLAGISFTGSVNRSNDLPKNMKITFRFPAELRFSSSESEWQTQLLFPVYQLPGPRGKDYNQGGIPSYWYEGFLLLQHVVSTSIIKFLNPAIQLPNVMLQRFPYPPYISDPMIEALKGTVPLLLMVSFVYTCINTVKVITIEKERQLKEAMKIMGLPNWLHWSAWFMKTFMFLMISVILIVILLKIPWYKGTDLTVFSNSDPSLILFFFICYVTASITFCFMVSAFFSRANTASLVAGMLWFFTYLPFMLMSEKYANLTLLTKLPACLLVNTGMAFGFQLFLMYEGNGEGMQWKNIWRSVTPDDDLVLGHVILMLLFDALLYLLIALYVEAVFPGEYGVPRPWYFVCQPSFCCRNSDYHLQYDTMDRSQNNNSDVYEPEPSNLKAGIQIKHMTKKFKKKKAVDDLNLNLFEGHITVLLGHNGAGKTTTMSMLTGMITPSSGTALVGGYDVRHDISKVRKSLGLCPQHNVLFEDLTVREHLHFFAKMKGLTGTSLKDEVNKYVSLLHLESKRNVMSSKLSGGMQRRLAAGVALCGGSKIVMFDEPTSGLDPAARRDMWELLQSEKAGRTILLTTQFMDEADLLGDRIAIMAGGSLQCCGSSFFLKKKYGAGYHLIIEKTPECNVDSVTRLLQNFIPNVTVDSNIGSELTYLLNENQASVFEQMFSKLEMNKNNLGLLGYGVSLTTMEEVFMKVGKDLELSDVKEVDHDDTSSHVEIDDGSYISGESRSRSPTYIELSGFALLWNQLLAMFMKKTLYVWRTWYITLIQVLLPVFFLTLAILILRELKRTQDPPALNINLESYGQTYTPIEVHKSTRSTYLSQLGFVFKNLTKGTIINASMSDYIIEKSKVDLPHMRQSYILGASFDTNATSDTIIGWFNNLPYHSVPLVTQMIYNSLLSYFTHDYKINMVNFPLPYTEESKLNYESWASLNVGFNMAFNLGFSMAFVSAFFIIFYVKERVSKAKHLQIASGVQVLTFWLSSLVWDLLLFLIPSFGVIITFAAFQEDGFSTSRELGRILIVLVCFSWSMLPATYLCSFIFKVPLTGFTIMTMINLFTGIASFMTVNVLKLPSLELQDVAKGLDWAFIIFPHYSLCSSISGLYLNSAYNRACARVLMIPQICMTPNACCKDNCPKTGCFERTDSYFDWKTPGIGRNVFVFILDGIIIIIILLMREFRLFERCMYFVQKYRTKVGTDDSDEEIIDSDVAAEKKKIHTVDTHDLQKDYEIVLKDVTKYYNDFLAVNQLCLAVKRGECFGLLGVNGAGKTTTFKMMTGDEKISSGDGYVCGLSLKSNMKQVHQMIGYCPQYDAVLEELTGRETLTMFCLLRGVPLKHCKTIVNQLAEELLITKHINKKIKEYSGGNKRKLSTAISLIGDPPVLYMDEPTTGMDPVAKRHLWNVICKVRDSGRCIVLTSHSMEECEALCTRLAIMVNGVFKCLGSTQHLKNKFAEGFTLMVKVKKMETSAYGRLSIPNGVDKANVDTYDLNPIRKFIAQSFPGANLMEEYQGLLTYCIPNPTLTWSRMFGIMEKAKRELNIEDYSVGQNSLEQVFLTFTKKQREDQLPGQ